MASGILSDENHFVFPLCFMYGSYADKSRDLSSDSSLTLLSRYSFSGMNLVTEHPVSINAKDTTIYICIVFFSVMRATSIVLIAIDNSFMN